jgi:hypothetical protein
MELSDFIVIILLGSCVSMWFANFFGKCPIPPPPPPPQIVYRYRPELDLQFDERNMPSKIYDDIFNSPNVYQGGYPDTVKKKSSFKYTYKNII